MDLPEFVRRVRRQPLVHRHGKDGRVVAPGRDRTVLLVRVEDLPHLFEKPGRDFRVGVQQQHVATARENRPDGVVAVLDESEIALAPHVVERQACRERPCDLGDGLVRRRVVCDDYVAARSVRAKTFKTICKLSGRAIGRNHNRYREVDARAARAVGHASRHRFGRHQRTARNRRRSGAVSHHERD